MAYKMFLIGWDLNGRRKM